MKKKNNDRPVIAITMGDPAGIGPEIILKALSDPIFYEKSKPLVIGVAEYFSKIKQIINSNLSISTVSDVESSKFKYGNIDLLDIDNRIYGSVQPGKTSAKGGAASIGAVKVAVKFILDGIAHAMVSAPTNKESMKLAGSVFPGQTELIANLTKTKNVTTLIIIGNVRIFQVTTHISLRNALSQISKEKVLNTIKFADSILKRMGIEKPRVSVSGLNPHAGENGLFGDEEIKEIAPAIKEAKEKGINTFGPYPCDSLFLRNRDGEFDAICTMYHDQATIAMKLLGIPCTMAIGLPIIRTSVGHGTAFDIAYKGIADASAFREALNIAISSTKMKQFSKIR